MGSLCAPFVSYVACRLWNFLARSVRNSPLIVFTGAECSIDGVSRTASLTYDGLPGDAITYVYSDDAGLVIFQRMWNVSLGAPGSVQWEVVAHSFLNEYKGTKAPVSFAYPAAPS